MTQIYHICICCARLPYPGHAMCAHVTPYMTTIMSLMMLAHAIFSLSGGRGLHRHGHSHGPNLLGLLRYFAAQFKVATIFFDILLGISFLRRYFALVLLEMK